MSLARAMLGAEEAVDIGSTLTTQNHKLVMTLLRVHGCQPILLLHTPCIGYGKLLNVLQVSHWYIVIILKPITRHCSVLTLPGLRHNSFIRAWSGCSDWHWASRLSCPSVQGYWLAGNLQTIRGQHVLWRVVHFHPCLSP